MKMKFVLSLVFIFLFKTGFSNPSVNQRKSIETSFNEFVSSGSYLQNYDKARSYLLKIIERSEKAGCWDISLGALSLLAYVAEMNYHYEVMKEAVEKGQRIMLTESAILDSLDPSYISRVDIFLMAGTYYIKNSELEKAANIFQSLIQRLNEVRTPDKGSVFKAYAYIADIYMNLGLYEKVYTYYMLMEKSIPDGADHSLFSYLHLQYLGTYFYQKKDYALAKSYLIAALQKIDPGTITSEWKNFIVSNYDILALIYQGLNRPDSARVYLKRSLALQQPDDPRIIFTYENFGDCLFKSGDFTGALFYYRKTYAIINKGKFYNAYKKAQVLSKIGESCYNQGNYIEALKTIQQAFVILYKDSSFVRNPAKNPEISIIQADKVMIKLLIIKSNALYELSGQANKSHDKLMASLSSFRLATLVTDEFRHMISTDDFKEFFVTDIRGMYERAMTACYSAYEISRNDSLIGLAFYFMEKSKNQVLLDAIKANHARKFSNIPDSLIAAENKYKTTIVQLENMLYNLKFNDADPQLLKKCEYECAKTQNEYEDFLKGLEQDYPRYFQLKYSNEESGIPDIRRYIKKGILIEFMVGENSIALIAFNQQKSVFKLLPRNAAFDRHLNGLLNDLGGSDADDRFSQSTYERFVSDAGSMYSLLLKQSLDALERTDELIIIPDGILCFLPFDVLIDQVPGKLDAMDYRNLNYLLRKYIIRYEYSAGLLVEQHAIKNRAGSKSTYLGFAPSYDQKEGLRKVEVLGRGSEFLMPLKFSNDEIESAAAIFRGKSFTGETANVQRFKEAVSASIIHFAGHTIINDSIPELSGMFFSTPDRTVSGNKTEEDVLYLNEIFNLNLNSNLAILSACETGSGKLLKGEGLMSIGRAFKYAGCPNLIMSLWKINDRSASEIINSFCRNLKKGQRKDVALRNAKIDYLKQSGINGRTHPFYWSAFVMIGNNDPMFHKKNTTLVISGLILMSVSLLLWYWQRKRIQKNKKASLG